MALKGFIELLRLERLAESRKAERQNNQQQQWQGVAFEVAGQRFVSPIGEITQVIAIPETLTPVPLSKPWLMGIANVRGQLLPLVDLYKFLNLNSQNQPYKKGSLLRHKVLVIKQQGVWVGLLVDAVSHIKKFSPDQYIAKSLPTSSPFLPYNHGQFVENEQQWPVFMPSLLIQDPRFLEASIR